MNTAYKGGLFVWECYYGLKSIVQTKMVTMIACLWVTSTIINLEVIFVVNVNDLIAYP